MELGGPSLDSTGFGAMDKKKLEDEKSTLFRMNWDAFPDWGYQERLLRRLPI